MNKNQFQIGSGKGPFVQTGPIASLRARRIGCQITVADLARRIGINHTTLSRWERGIGSPDLSSFIAWAEELGMELPAWMR